MPAPTVKTRPILCAETTLQDPAAAVKYLADELQMDNMAGMIFFCSDHYPPEELAAEFKNQFDCPVVGCTTAGEIGSRYQENGIVAVSFGSEKFRIHHYLIQPLDDFSASDAKIMADKLRSQLEFSPDFKSSDMFAMLLLDGLSVKEEPVTAFVHSALQGVSLIGGSAGDNLKFEQTRVFADGAFHSGAAALILIESKLPFRTFKLQHFEPSGTDLVITEADPKIRTVFEIDGGPAAEEYASILGMEVDALTPQVFSRHPLMLQIGEEWYVRSIQKVNPDGSLTFFCAIDEGLPLTIAKGVGFVETLKAKVEELVSEFSSIECTIGCDCILRRLEIAATDKVDETEAALEPLNFIGFSTFGEQFDSVHINQTLTGVVLGDSVT